MIIATYRDGDVVWRSGAFVVDPPDDVVMQSLLRPVEAVRGVERMEAGVPVHERVIVTVEPGTAEHARNSIRRLPDARVLLDDGDD